MSQANGIKQVGYFDCAGGGQVVVSGTTAFIGHMKSPHGTTIVDVSDPKHPRELASLPIGPEAHSHKVRAVNGIMVVNREPAPRSQPPSGFKGGVGIYDVSKPSAPRHLTSWECKGVHRFTFDGRYAYLSADLDGYAGNIVQIVDLKDPARPEEVGRWWMPGQWTAGGETPSWQGKAHRCHHPIRVGNRLYVSYWLGGFVILDIEDMAKPKFISGLDWSPPYAVPTHSTVPVPFPLMGRRVMLVADEDVQRPETEPAAFLWLVDITDEKHPVQFSSYQVAGIDGSPQPTFTGCHQPVEEIKGPEVPCAWFAYGLRVLDISNPRAPREAAYFMPDVPAGADRVCSNDVFVDERGLIYLIDRTRGLSILERA